MKKLLGAFAIGMTGLAPAVAQDASDATIAANNALREYLPFEDQRDFENATRGFIATIEDPEIRGAAGNLVIDLSFYDFIDGDAPDTANPSLWRQSQLNALHGLYEVTEGIYQVRAFDLANVSFIRGDTGWIVVDPLLSTETAAAAYDLISEQVEELPISAVIYTHSHVDHFGGVKGLIDQSEVDEGSVTVIGPEEFFIESVNENLLAGTHMSRRAQYMYGNAAGKSATGSLGSGLGTTTAAGTVTIIEPTIDIEEITTGGSDPEEMVVDGVEMIFHNTPGAEAPAELMFYMPEYKAMMQAEIINHTFHNLYTLRGAQVRNGLFWSKYIHDAIVRYGDDVEISFGSHHWPTWGNEEIVEFWKGQRDTYRYVHDEALRLANHGMTMLEVAEEIQLPDSLGQNFSNRGYYGSVNHNAKAQYQLYFGWFSGNPSELHELPPEAEAVKFVEYAGGADAVIEKARADYEAGAYRWVATALNHVVYADPENEEARTLLADTLTQMGYQAESGPWRNFFLSGATELRNGVERVAAPNTASPDIIRSLALETYLDFLGVRLNGPKAAGMEDISLNMILTDVNEQVTIKVENATLNYTIGQLDQEADATIVMARSTLDDINLMQTSIEQAILNGDLTVVGNAEQFGNFLSLLDVFDVYFNIVTP
ncbi:MAG: alkyl sulfatase dimerization domain-containing protein [Dinoroseobacter sp.]|nr:alkyl sulfatase dimerization domain-containing protein [Dinoroseobacter sp.]